MTAVKVIGVILLVILLIMLIRVGVSAEYSEDGFIVDAKLGPYRMRVLPAKKGGEKKPGKKKKPKQTSEDEDEKEKKGGSVKIGMPKISSALEALGRLGRRLTINELTLIYTSAASDPYDAAVNFGRVSAAAGILQPLLDRGFRIKKQYYDTRVSFDGEGDTIYGKIALSLAIFDILYIAAAVLPDMLGKTAEKRKVDKNG